MLTVRVDGDDGVGRRAVLVDPPESCFQRDAVAPVFLVGDNLVGAVRLVKEIVEFRVAAVVYNNYGEAAVL